MDAELIRQYTLIVDFLGHVLGPDYEIVYAAVGLFAGGAGVAGVGGLAGLYDLRLDALGLQRVCQLPQRCVGAALLVGAAVDE